MTKDRHRVVESLDLYDWVQPQPLLGRPLKNELTDWRVVDDWPDVVPVTTEEIDVFERWFGDILDELIGPA
jgi:hypothetical protein